MLRHRVVFCVVGALAVGMPLFAAEPPVATSLTHIVLIGGFDSDPTPEQLAGTARRGEGNSGMFQLQSDLRAERISTEYFNWNGTPPGKIGAENPPGSAAIADHLRQQISRNRNARIGIVGNSWGGHTAWEVCHLVAESTPELKLPIVIFLDPSSAGRPNSKRPAALPKNVVSAVQYASRSAVVWAPWQNEPRVIAIDLADSRHGFLRAGGPPYGAILDPHAHIGAEWDGPIHIDIRKRLKETLP